MSKIENIFNQKYDTEKIKVFYYFVSITLLIFMPKINLIKIPGYWQGVRLDDFILLSYAIILISKIHEKINKKFIGVNFFIFFPYLVFTFILTYIVGESFGTDKYNHYATREWIFIIRYIEYMVLIFLIIDSKIDKKLILNLIKIFLLINLLVAILQMNRIFPSFLGRGIVMPNEFNIYQFHQGRETGLLGGPWELAVISCICFFILFQHEKNKLHKLIFFLITIFFLIITESRGILITSVISFLFLVRDIKLFILAIFFGVALLFVGYKMEIFAVQKVMLIDFGIIFDLMYDFIVNAKIPTEKEAYELGGDTKDDYALRQYVSFYYRMVWWNNFYELFRSNPFYVLFGTSMQTLYLESLIFRVIFSFGIVGTCLALYLARNIPFYFFVFILVAGLTIDLYISFKIFLFSYLLVYIHYIDNPKKLTS